MEPFTIFHVSLEIVTVFYLLILGGNIMPPLFNNKGKETLPPAIASIRRAVAFTIIEWAFTYVAYIPAIFLTNTVEEAEFANTLTFLFVSVITIPFVIWMMNEICQRKVKVWVWLPIAVIPTSCCAIWYAISRDNLAVYMDKIFIFTYLVIYTGVYRGQYIRYRKLVRIEYSDISNRDISWALFIWGSLTLQLTSFLILSTYGGQWLSITNALFNLFNTTIIVYCARRILPLSQSLVDNQDEDTADGTQGKALSHAEKNEEIICQRLKVLCEEKQLYLSPDLTREMLCERIKINRTYLSEYLRKHNTTYYHYINRLRIRHACRLINENPRISAYEVSASSGYNNPTTFRKAFREIMDMLPSEYANRVLAAGPQKFVDDENLHQD